MRRPARKLTKGEAARAYLVLAAIVALLFGVCVLIHRSNANFARQAQEGACAGQITQSCLDQLSNQVHDSEAAWCEQNPTDDGCKYSANPDPSQYK